MEELFYFPKYKIKKPIRLIELFAGVGSQAMALRNIGANFESWYVCEFDRFAIASYNAIHGTNYPTSDVTKIHADDLKIIDRDNYEYILTYSFPCTDLSVAGKMQGMRKGSGTRSGLLWEVERLLNECGENLPHVLLMENVPQVITAEGFDDWLDFLKSKGYINHYKVLNAKNYGVAQNRERCFMISILSPDYLDFDFPKEKKLDKCINDYLENEVDEKYYINNEKAYNLIKDITIKKEGLYRLKKLSENGKFKSLNEAYIRYEGGVYAHTITARYYKGIGGDGDNVIVEKC